MIPSVAGGAVAVSATSTARWNGGANDAVGWVYVRAISVWVVAVTAIASVSVSCYRERASRAGAVT